MYSASVQMNFTAYYNPLSVNQSSYTICGSMVYAMSYVIYIMLGE